MLSHKPSTVSLEIIESAIFYFTFSTLIAPSLLKNKIRERAFLTYSNPVELNVCAIHH